MKRVRLKDVTNYFTIKDQGNTSELLKHLLLQLQLRIRERKMLKHLLLQLSTGQEPVDMKL
jgi:hypothetical protein